MANGKKRLARIEEELAVIRNLVEHSPNRVQPVDASKVASQVRSILADDPLFQSGKGRDKGTGDVFTASNSVRRVRRHMKSIGMEVKRYLMQFIHFHVYKTTGGIPDDND